MEKVCNKEDFELLNETYERLIEQEKIEKSCSYTISKVCTRKANGLVVCDIYPFLGKEPDETKKISLKKIIEVVYGENAYNHESIVNLLKDASKNLPVRIKVNSNEELIELFIKAGNILNNQFISINERKVYGTLMKAIQSGIAKSIIILDKRKDKLKLCIDTIGSILKSIKKETLIEIKNSEEFYKYLDEILFIENDDNLFSDLLKTFVLEYNNEISEKQFDKKITRCYDKINKTYDNNLKDIYKSMPKYTDSDFYKSMDAIEALYDENMPENYSNIMVYLGLHRMRKIRKEKHL